MPPEAFLRHAYTLYVENQLVAMLAMKSLAGVAREVNFYADA